MTPVLLIAFAAYALLAWKDRRTAFLVFVGALPAYLIRFRVSGYPTTALEVLFLILFAAWFFKREKRLIDIRGWRLLLFLWLIAATMSLFVSPDFRAAAGIWKAYFVEPAVFFLIAGDFLRTEADRTAAIRSLAWAAIIVAAGAIIQRFTGWGVPPPFNAAGEFRSTSFYGFPNAVGLFLGPLVPLFVYRFKSPGARLFLSAAILSVTTIFLAQSEGALIGLTAGLGFMLLMFKRTQMPALLIGSLALIALLIVPATSRYLVERATLSDWSGRVRKLIWQETWTMLKDRPILGAGLSGYPVVFKPYHPTDRIEVFQYPHNIVLNFWSELGLFGLLTFLAIIIQFFRQVFVVLFSQMSKVKSQMFGAALAASMIVILVHGLVDVPYFKNDLAMLFWLFIALANSTAKLPDRS